MRPVDRRYLARLGVGRRHLGRAGLGADHLVGLHVVRLVVVGVHLVGLVVVRFVVVGVHLVGVVVVRVVVVWVVVVRVVVELGRLVDRALGLTVSEPAAPNDTAPTGRGVATRAQIVLLAIVIWVLAALLAVTVAGHQGWMDATGWSAWFGFLVLAPAFADMNDFDAAEPATVVRFPGYDLGWLRLLALQNSIQIQRDVDSVSGDGDMVELSGSE